MNTTSPRQPRFNRLLGIVRITALVAAATFGAQASSQLPPTHSEGGLEYTSGGFGIDESTAFKQAMHGWPLALTFASGDESTAAYAGNVQVVIRNKSAATVLNVTSDGPYFLAKLPSGNYEVSATYENQTQSRKVSITEGRTSQLVFRWNRPAAGPD